MKKIISLLTTALLILSFSVTAFAIGDDNIEGGGGDMGGGTSINSWTPGRDGVRVTVIRDSDKTAVTTPIDFSDEANSDIKIHYGKVTKLQYIRGTGLIPKGGKYVSIKPATTMPMIIDSNGNNNIEAIRKYFCDKGTIEFIAKETDFNYDRLINGEYKLLIEPIAYFKYNGVMYAMTATEAALLNQIKNNDLHKKMTSLSHKNLPLSMFLREPELGLPAWTGSTTTTQSDQTIISHLGMGIVRFKELPPEPPNDSDVVYRTDTDVITSVTLSTESEKNPDSPAYAKFSINGKTYAHSDIYIPENGSQQAWVKWRTPKEEGTISITVSSNCDLDVDTIVANIVDLDNNPPPDPQANDRNDNFRKPSVPNKGNVTSLTWGEWDAWWHEYWVDNGRWVGSGENRQWRSKWEDEGWYVYDWISYTATLTANMKIKPDEKAPTATSSQMKSGYGFNMEISSDVRSNAPTSHYTGMQNSVAYFPEFQYGEYWRLLERKSEGYSIDHEFKKNKYSTYNRRSHFTPVWYPDGTYTAYAESIDAWTPSGMMSIKLDDDIRIKESLYSDWHIRPIK